MDSYSFDKLQQLSDGAAAYVASGIAQVAGANQILNFGAPLPRTDLGIIGELANIKVAVVIDVSAINNTAGQAASYRISIMGSNNANGSNPVVLGSIMLGLGTLLPNGGTSAGGAPAGTGSDSYPGRYIIFADMVQADINYEYLYLYTTIAGTTPSITYTAFAAKWPKDI